MASTQIPGRKASNQDLPYYSFTVDHDIKHSIAKPGICDFIHFDITASFFRAS
jgi:hypothetical protein